MPEQKKRKKCPTPQKRVRQDEKKRALNRSFRSRVRTAINCFNQALSRGKPEEISLAKSAVYRLVDKGTKKGIYKKNKAARVKKSLSSPQKQLV